MTDIISVDKKRSKILLEHREPFVLYNGEIRRYHIEKASEISEEMLQTIYKEVLQKRVKERVLHILQSMDRTEYEIRDKLKKGYYPEEIIEYAVEFLKKYNYIDDQRYAQNYINACKGKKSRKIIQQSLYLKGISKEIAEEAFELLEDNMTEGDERAIIYTLLEKRKYKYEAADSKEKNRTAAFLLRKGFEMEDIIHCMRNQP